MSNLFVSVIIPVLRDSEALSSLLERLRPNRCVEVIVANGDSVDPGIDTLKKAWPMVRWLNGPTGRGRQMNLGSEWAKGRWLLFLHADARPGQGWYDEICRADDEGVAGGCYRLRINSVRWQARLIEIGARYRVQWFGLAYGDQGLFIRRDLFRVIGGYRTITVMEDLDLVRRMRRHGRLLYSKVGIFVSARRWERDGWAWRTFSNLRILMLYLVGLSPERLAASYPTWPGPRRSSDGDL